MTEPSRTDEARAAARPAPVRAGAVGACYLYRAASGLLATAPLAVAFAAVVGAHPRGDALLWEPGGVWLVESLRLLGPALGPALGYGGVLVLLAAFGWLLPLGALIVSLAPGRPRARVCLGQAAARLGTMSLLWGLTLLAQAALLVLTAVLSALVAEGESPAQLLLRLGVWLLGLSLCAVLACTEDLARVVCLQRDAGLWDAVAQALGTLGRHPLALAWAAGWRSALGLGLLAGALALGVAWARPDELLPMVLLHQLAILCFVWLRASWLRQATRLVG
jgi:hypothetical protein